MCLLHGYTSVAKWFAGSAVDFCDPRNDLIRVFLEYVEDEVSFFYAFEILSSQTEIFITLTVVKLVRGFQIL